MCHSYANNHYKDNEHDIWCVYCLLLGLFILHYKKETIIIHNVKYVSFSLFL
jgi:hypothetical protein